jgi:parallel beta-helix repeat protein
MRKVLTFLMAAIIAIALTFTSASTINAAGNKWIGSIVVNADGSVTPADAPLQRSGDEYTLISNVLSDSEEALTIYRSNIILDGAGYSIEGNIAYPNSGIYVQGSTNFTIRNFVISNLFCGITLDETSQGKISQCNIYQCSIAIQCVNDNSEIVITENLLTRNDAGIEPWFGTLTDSAICDNQITQNGNGFYNFEGGFFFNDEISRNNISSNNCGIMFLGYHASARGIKILQNEITGNNEGIVSNGGEDHVISNNSFIDNTNHAIYFAGDAQHNLISGNRIENNGAGILLNPVEGIGFEVHCSFNEITGNSIKDNLAYGVHLNGADENIIKGNNITGNMDGITTNYHYVPDEIYYSNYPNNNLIVENNIANNQRYGVQLLNATNNSLYHNSFNNNGQQVYSINSTNIWDNGYPSGGNGWSDYTGVDSNGDGIGDTPYIIDQTNQDRYPLVDSVAPSFSDGFETGSFSNWVGTAGTSGETVSINTFRRHHGAYSARFTSNGGGGYERAYCYQAIDSSEVYARGYFFVSQSGIRERNDRFFCLILNSGANGLAYAGWRQTSNGLRWCLTARDETSYVDVFSSNAPSTGRWYCVELHWKRGVDGLAEMWVDGNLVCQVNPNTDAFGDATQLRVGLAEIYRCRSTIVYGDCIKVADCYVGTEVVADTTRPTVSSVSVYPTSFRPRFGQTTRLSYSISEECQVTVRVYSRSGALVRTIVEDEQQAAGTQRIVWNGRADSGSIAPRGTYSIRLYVEDLAGNKAATYPITRTVTVR